ncbi:hypothetical protein [Crocosphaera subtropica]|nr:hypothetical protein [Crocosphaera subtropica]
MEDITQSYFTIAIRKNHSFGCPADPDTVSVIDRYRIYPVTQQILG